VYLLKHFANLGIELRGGMEDKALENQADGVQRGGADEDGEAGGACRGELQSLR